MIIAHFVRIYVIKNVVCKHIKIERLKIVIKLHTTSYKCRENSVNIGFKEKGITKNSDKQMII